MQRSRKFVLLVDECSLIFFKVPSTLSMYLGCYYTGGNRVLIDFFPSPKRPNIVARKFGFRNFNPWYFEIWVVLADF